MNDTQTDAVRFRTAPTSTRIATCSLLFALCACGTNTDAPTEPVAEVAEVEPPSAEASVGPVLADAVAERVDDARSRLATSEAGQLVWQSIEAHGGLETWLRQGTLAFDFNYRPLGHPTQVRYTRQRVDLRSARAVHEELGDGADARFGWDGEQAWMLPGPDAFPSSARFWALTPYYFLGMPFVLGDPGVQLELLPDAEVDGTSYRLVKVTYEAGTGDSPDDYYIVYLHPETHRLAMLRYVVSFPGFFADGGHTPEKLMRYTDMTTVNGLDIASRLDTFSWDAETQTPGPLVTEIIVSEVSFGQPIPITDFQAPEGASASSEIEFQPR